MTFDEIAQQTQWNHNKGLGNLTLFIPMLDAHLPVVLFPHIDADPAVTANMVETINDVLQLTPAEIPRIKALLWEEAEFAIKVTDYGGVRPQPGETREQAHFRHFGLHTPDDALAKCQIREIHVTDEYAHRYAELKIDTATDNLVSIIIKNGRIIDFDDDGTHLGAFDDDDRHAHNLRQRTLNGGR